MQISFIYDCVYPFSKGGAEKRIFEYSHYLSHLFNVEIVSMNWWGGYKNILIDNLNYRAVCRKLELFNNKGKRNPFSAFIFGIKTFFYVSNCSADILDFEVFPYFPIIFARIARFFKKRKPLIIGYWSECLGENGWKSYSDSFWFIGTWLEKICGRCCDVYLANSSFTKNRLTGFLKIPSERIVVIPPFGIDFEKISAVPKAPDLDFDLIYFGRLIQHKNVDKLIQLAWHFKQRKINIKILIIGNGPRESFLKQQREKLYLTESVFFIDFVDSYEKLISLIKTAKICILPSEREGFGISVIEANACGLPVLVMDFPDNAAKELIISGENGYVCKDDDDLFQKVFYLLHQNHNIDQYNKKAKEISVKYRNEVIYQAVANYYSRLGRG
jgi:glycosyltransferase involved in cell wall biosynthesis